MKRKQSIGRQLRLEALEERRMLATLIVDDDGDDGEFTTIQAAVNAAVAGDMIRVRPGTYEESVLVTKQLTIKGAEPRLSQALDPTRASIVDPPADNDDNDHAVGFNLQANGIVIEGFTIGEFDGAVDDEGTIGIMTSPDFSGYTIEDNVFQGNTIGIRLNTATSSEADETSVEENVFRDNDRTGSSQGNAIISDLGLRNVEIEDNEFTGDHSATAIRITGVTGEGATVQSDINIEDNEFEDLTGGGIYWERVVDSVIEDNEFENLELAGIQLNGGNLRNTIEDNELEDVGTDGFNGIFLNNSSEAGANTNNTIEDNEVEEAGLGGIVLQNSNNNTVRDNEIEETRVFGTTQPVGGNGISLLNADNNTIEDNETEDNARHGIFVDSASTGNMILDNESEDNDTADIDGFDYNDDTTGGMGPDGVQNTYQRNRGGTANRNGLIQ